MAISEVLLWLARALRRPAFLARLGVTSAGIALFIRAEHVEAACVATNAAESWALIGPLGAGLVTFVLVQRLINHRADSIGIAAAAAAFGGIAAGVYLFFRAISLCLT